jgi:methyltransferase family protein
MLTDLLKWTGRRAEPPVTGVPVAAARGDEPLVPSKALSKFISLLAQRTSPLVLDLGPVVGNNVQFFGDRLGCKMVIEDLTADIDRHTRAGTMNALAASLDTRFRHAEASVDGIVCWDCFDFLDKVSAPALAHQIVRMLKPGGVVIAFFCTSTVETSGYAKYDIVDAATVRQRAHPGIGGARLALPNRDIIRMFDGLTVADSFLLKNNTREMLLRRP